MGARAPASFPVRLEPSGARFDAPADVTLLRAAEHAGIRLPSSCRNGTCRTCMCRSLHGQVHYRIERPGLSPDEKREGWILPCVAYPLGALRLDTPHARPIDPTPPKPIAIGPRF